MELFLTAETQRTRRALFSIGRVEVRKAMRVFPLAAFSANGKKPLRSLRLCGACVFFKSLSKGYMDALLLFLGRQIFL
jgi:hypothetical protein